MNCRRTQSLLSAYLDGELTGEEMIGIRKHLSLCEFCSDELGSLQIVKQLLGSLDSVEAECKWSSTVTTHAYADSRPWWERPPSMESWFVRRSQLSAVSSLSPRGTRMVRALALSTAVVLLAAVRLSSIERLDQGVTGKLAASMGLSVTPWSVGQHSDLESVDSTFLPDQFPRWSMDAAALMPASQRYTATVAQPAPTLTPSELTSACPLTFVAATQK